MTGRITQILRHPIKSHGREAVAHVSLHAGQTLPWDRLWAVAHDRSDADGSEWVSCHNFTRGVKAPGLAAMTAQLNEETEYVTLKHPDLGELCFHPDSDGEHLIDWTRPLMPTNRAASARVIRSQTRGLTDSRLPSITLCNMSSHRAVSQRLGRDLSIYRWRGNIWFDGLAPWEEFDWIDREIRVGSAVVAVRSRTERCLHTHDNPDTGKRDANILGVLEEWGHRDFSVKAEVIESGEVALGDPIGLA